jgi:hypothetical protein
MAPAGAATAAGAVTAAVARPATATASAARGMNQSGMSLPTPNMSREVTPK